MNFGKLKYLLALLLTNVIYESNLCAQTTFIVAAAGGTHTTIASAYAACNTAGTNYIIEIRTTGGTPYANTEVIAAPIVLGANFAASIIIRPEAGSALFLSTAAATSIFSFTGGDNITLDGRAGGVGINALTIENTQVAASKYAIQFTGGSTFNTIKYCTIKGSNGSSVASNASGVIMFGAGSNANNIINNCTIQESGASKPSVGIMSFDATGNNLLTITNNSFVNYTAKGIWASSSQSGWNIIGNSFYQTAAFISTVNMLQIDNGGNYTIIGNYFGGQAPNCGGAAYTLNSGATTSLSAIYFLNSVWATTNIVSGNTIQNISITSTNTGASALLKAIVLGGAANFNCGSSGNGNIIGKSNGTGSIILTNNAGSGSLGFEGITCNSSGNNSIVNNIIAGIIVNGTHTGATSVLINNITGTTLVDNNSLGSNIANSILVSSNSTLIGISNISASGLTVTNNIIQNVNHAAITLAFKGIYNSLGVFNCAGNTIKNIITTAAITHNIIDHTGSNAIISDNTIQDISLTSATTGIFNGINTNSTANVNISNNIIGSSIANNINIACNDYYSNGINNTGSGPLNCIGNTIQNILLSNIGINPVFQGISTTAGVLTFSQNIIRNIINNSTGSSNAIIGIYVNSAMAGHTISKNTITGLIAKGTTPVAGYVTGIRVSNGSGLIEKNFIKDLQLNFTSATAEIDGMDLTIGSWDVFNNVVLLQNGNLTNSVIIEGIYFRGGATSRVFHNTIRIAGGVTVGAAGTVALDMNSTGAKTIENNILQNLRTGGTGSYYAENIQNTATSLNTNYNYLEVVNNPTQLCKYLGLNKTFASWKAIPVGANDKNFTIAIDPVGVVINPTPGDVLFTGFNLSAMVPDDINGTARSITPFLGAYEGLFSITTSAIAPTNYCSGSNIIVPYAVSQNYLNGNVFSAELSDASGSFASPTIIGTLTSITSGAISGTIPPNAAVGAGYRIRVVSDQPVTIGNENGSNLTINTSPSFATAGSDQTVCGTSATLAANIPSVGTGLWSVIAGTGSITSPSANNSPVTGLTAGSTSTLRWTITNGSCTYYDDVNIAALPGGSGTPGTLDFCFNSNDLGFDFGIGANNTITASALTSDGKIIIGGSFTLFNGITISNFARLNADGSLDNTFNIGTGANGAVTAIAILPDGKIVIGGSFTSYNGTACNYIARLNNDGTFDNTFNIGSGANSSLLTVIIQINGKIIIGGNFTVFNGTACNYIARLNADGTIDNTFNIATGVNNSILAAAIQSDGKIIIGGNFTLFNLVSTVNRIARLNSDGTLDNAFATGTGTGASSTIRTLAIQTDGKIVIGGLFTTYNTIARSRVARINTDGSLEMSFDPGTGASSNVYAAVLQPDGKIVIGGQFTSYNAIVRKNLARINSDGTIDATFTPVTGFSITTGTCSVQTLSLQADGKVIAGGSFDMSDKILSGRISRSNTDGTIDRAFNPYTGADNSINDAAVQPDGKVVIVGKFKAFNGTQSNCVARLNADGTYDASFNSGTGIQMNASPYFLYSVAVQPDGKIIIGGNYVSYNGTAISYFSRLNTDGSLDGSFNVGTSTNDMVFATVMQPDGKILIGGQYTTYNGTSRNYIARVNSDGTLDTSFDPGSGADGPIYAIALQSDGKIIIGGQFSFYNGIGKNKIARINADGTLDGTFNPGTGPDNYIYYAAIQPDGKIIITGSFTTYNGTGRNYIARVNTNGTLDGTFNPGTGPNTSLSNFKSTTLQADGKIIVAGDFTSYNGTARNRLARLNTNGTIDAVFDPAAGTATIIRVATMQTDGKIIIGGDFTSYNNSGRNRLCRVNGEMITAITTSPVSPTIFCIGGSVNVVYTASGSYVAGNIFTAQLSDGSGSFATPTTIGTLTSTSSGTIAATIPSVVYGTGYRIRVVSDNPIVIGSDNGTSLALNPPNGGIGSWTWTGEINDDWFNCSNWDRKCLPDANSDVSIPGGTLRNPKITGSSGSCKTIHINTTAGGHLNIDYSGSGHLNVAQ